MDLKIFKFGGSSVKNAERIALISDIIQSFSDNQLVVVISAMGKTTNELEHVYATYLTDNDSGITALDLVIDKHVAIAKELGLDEHQIMKKLQAFVVDNLSSIAPSEHPDQIYDGIISLGELFSTTIIVEYLKSRSVSTKWLDVRHVLATDGRHKNAKVDFQLTSNKISKKTKKYFQDAQVIITQGFIGKSEKDMTTTLGREGSDYTAAIFAYALDVEDLTIWKDVPGILTADPRRFDNVELLEKLSYREAIEMTYYGAKVIHPKTIQPIQNKRIKLNVRSFLSPQETGTLISDLGMLNYPPIVVVQDGVILLQIVSKDFSFIAEEHLSIIYDKMAKYNISSSVTRNSAISFTLGINHLEDSPLQKFIHSLGKEFEIETYKGLQLITIRHVIPGIVENLTKNKVVLFEETLKNTVQLVVRPTKALVEKELATS